MGPWDYVIILAVATLIAFAIFMMIRNRKKGKCSCGCEGCASAAVCHRKETLEREEK